MKATTSHDQIPLIYVRVYVTKRELSYATMTAIRHNDSEESVRDRFLARFPTLVCVTPVLHPRRRARVD